VFFEVSCSSSSSSSSINTKSSVQCVKKRDSNIERGEGVKNKKQKTTTTTTVCQTKPSQNYYN